MKHIVATLLFIGVLLGCGCKKVSLGVERSSNPDINVELLLEHDGCKIYRFYDTNFVYFTKCGETSNIVSCGKNCRRLQRNLK